MKQIAISFLALLIISCSSVKFLTHKPTLISEQYLTQDTLEMQIAYTQIPSCTERLLNQLTINVRGQKSTLLYRSYEGTVEEIGPLEVRLIQDVYNFEKYAKTNTSICGGYDGGNGVEIQMMINQDSTKFAYCQDEWDGIEELLEVVRSNKMKN